MTQPEINNAHHKLAMEYSRGQLTFDEFKAEVKKLDSVSHDHIYRNSPSGEMVCYCGAQK